MKIKPVIITRLILNFQLENLGVEFILLLKRNRLIKPNILRETRRICHSFYCKYRIVVHRERHSCAIAIMNGEREKYQHITKSSLE